MFAFFTGWLPSAEPATEPLYVLALLQPSHDVPRVSLWPPLSFRVISVECIWQAVCERVASMAVELTLQLDVRRAALHYLAVLCDRYMYISIYVYTAFTCT